MGREATCEARSGRQSGEGKAQLEHDHVLFRGEFRVKLALATLSEVSAKAGVLTLRGPEGSLALALGKAAETWAEAIRNPRTLLDKLGIEPGQSVVVLGVKDAAFLRDLKARLNASPATRAKPGCDHILFAAGTKAAHARLAALKEAIRPAGGIWAIYPRGHDEVSEDSLRQAARAAGLTDIKICRFSESHGAVRLVIPKALRGAPAPRARAAKRG